MLNPVLSRRAFCVGTAATAVALALPSTAASAAPYVTEIAVWGDSMTHKWPQMLQDLVGIPVYPGGVGGSTITQINAKYDAWTTPNTGHILWGGHCDCNKKSSTLELIVPTISQMFAHADPGRFLALGLTNGPGYERGTDLYNQVILGVNPTLSVQHGDHYVDMRRYLITDGMSLLGLPPTQQDYVDISNDIPPSSLRTMNPGQNPGHLNDNGREVVVNRLNAQVRLLGWLPPQ